MKIVVAVDGSECSQGILQSLHEMKWCQSNEIKVITVVDPFLEKEKQVDLQQIEKMLDETTASIALACPASKISQEILQGSPHDRMIEYLTDWGADLLVVGAHARPSAAQLMLGKVSDSLLSHAPCSVMVVKQYDLSSGAPYRNVLIPVDETEQAAWAFECVTKSAWPDDVTFHIVTVTSQEKTNSSEAMDKVEAERLVQAYAARFNEKLGSERCTYEVLEGPVRDEILRCAESLPAGLIVIGSHGWNLIDRVLTGSVSHSIALQSECSVEVIRQAA